MDEIGRHMAKQMAHHAVSIEVSIWLSSVSLNMKTHRFMWRVVIMPAHQDVMS